MLELFGEDEKRADQYEVKGGKKKRKYGNKGKTFAPKTLVAIGHEESGGGVGVGEGKEFVQKGVGSGGYDKVVNMVRLSQACDRCRLKKVKCDGLKPSCSQCLKVNFLCKTSDKLTRRGFPKGYTEMLEKEVVVLQQRLSELESKENVVVDSGSNLVRENCRSKVDSEVEPQGKDFWDSIIKESIVNGDIFLKDNSRKVFVDKGWLIEFQLSVLISNLQLNPQYSYLPTFLINKTNTNLSQLKELISLSSKNFAYMQNSILPIIYPCEDLSQITDLNNNTIKRGPITILIICYLIQLNWSCFDKFKLFEITKMIIIIHHYYNFQNDDDNDQSIMILNLLNLSIYYFMSVVDSHNLHIIGELFSITNIFINDNFKFKNSAAPQSMNRNKDDDKDTERNEQYNKRKNVSISCYKFLSNLWNLLHKNNINTIKPLDKEFENDLLSEIVDEDLNLFKLINQFILVIKQNQFLDNEKLSFYFEEFKDILIKENLFFNNNENFLEHSLSLRESKSLQLTLYYLILKLVVLNSDTTGSLYTEVTKGKSNTRKKESTNFKINDKSSLILDQNKVENTYQVLLTYHNFLTNASYSLKDQPQQFFVKYFLPCQNSEIIRFSLLHLNCWYVNNKNNFTGDISLPINWNLLRFQTFLARFCTLWFFDDMKNVLLGEIQKNFKFELSMKLKISNSNLNKYNKLGYLQSISNFNDTNKLPYGPNLSFFFGGRTNLLRSNSSAIMDQFNMFTDNTTIENTNLNSQPTELRKHMLSEKSTDMTNASQLDNGVTTDDLPPFFESFSLKSLTQINGTHGTIDMTKYPSQILRTQEETDDGYAEDDDDDENQILDDDTKPLEIPFGRKRHESLFQTKYHRLPSTVIHTHDSKGKVGKNRRSTIANNVSAIILPGNAHSLSSNHSKLDHIILNNQENKTLNSNLPDTNINAQTEKKKDDNYITKDKENIGNSKFNNRNELSNHGLEKPNNSLLFRHNSPSVNNFNFIETPRSFSDMLMLQSNSNLNIMKNSVFNPTSTDIETTLNPIVNMKEIQQNTKSLKGKDSAQATPAHTGTNLDTKQTKNTLMPIPSLLSVDKFYK